MDVISGKVAIITGAAAGIGAAHVNRLFKGGMKGCTIADINESGEALAKEMNCTYGKNKAIFVKADVTKEQEFERVFKENMAKFKKLDLLVNNAGLFRDRTWRQMIDLNVNATVTGSLLGIKYMGKNNGFCGGTIVNTSSIGGLSPIAHMPCYAGTKHFVVGFTRSIGSGFWYDLTGIKFMSICPGPTVTSMIGQVENFVFDDMPGLGRLATRELSDLPHQTVDEMAEALNDVLNFGSNGSVWVSEGGEPVFEVRMPARSDMKQPRC